MIYLKFRNGLICQISETYPKHEEDGWKPVVDAESFQQAASWARYMTAMTGIGYIPIDDSQRVDGVVVQEKFGVIKKPMVGDEVSYSFNGDSYPCGVITKITPSWQITTSTGKKFRRFRMSGSWKAAGGTWWMVKGHIDERNPHI